MEQLELNLTEATKEIKEKMNTVAESFVFIGYRLRQILDSGAFGQVGYTNIYDYAEQELSLNATAVSRFIAINKKYSIGGYGPELQEQYKGYGSSKLSEMLTLPEEDCAVIGAETPVKQIREYKNFLKDEPKEEDGQICMQEEQTGSSAVSAGLKELLIDYFEKNMDMLRRILDETATPEILQEQMNPTGVHNIQYKISFLMLKDLQHGVVYRQLGNAPETMTWQELLDTVRTELSPEYEAMAKQERAVKEREKKSIATSQVKKVHSNVESEPEEEQLPGQTSIEDDFPEIMPQENPETPISTQSGGILEEPDKEEPEVEKAEEKLAESAGTEENNGDSTVKRLDLTICASELYGLVQKMDYAAAVPKCEELLNLLKRKAAENE